MRWSRLLAAALVVATACTGGDDGDAAPTVRHEERPPAIDYTGAHLAGVPGTTTTTGVAETGTASIVGTVTGPGGLVPGANVRVEHLIGRGSIIRDVSTGPDGRFSLPGIPGGRYRVRAFLVPALAGAKAEVRFLEDGKESVFDLTVEDQRKVVATAGVAPSVPYLYEGVNLSVLVATQAVDADGVVRSTPIPGLRVELDGLGAWSLRRDDVLRTPLQPRATTTTTTALPPSTTSFTDSFGVVRYALQCDSVGPPGLGILVTVTVTPAPTPEVPVPTSEQRVDRLALKVPDCVDPAAVAATSSTTPPRTTDTTEAGDR